MIASRRNSLISEADYEPAETPLPRPDAPHVPASRGYRWVPDWGMSDEFENGSRGRTWIQQHRWEKTNSKWRGRPPGFFKKSNVSVNQGSLHLYSHEDTAPKNYPSMYHSYSTSFVRTKKSRLYGYFEIMCRLMDSPISSAFWFARNDHDLWTELDVFEYSTSRKPSHRGIPYKQLFNTNMHIHRHYDPSVGRQSHPKAFDLDFDLSEIPIRVGFNWQQDTIEWYVNDGLVRKEENLHFHQPLHLQLDSETFPNWFGLPNFEERKNLPRSFQIYYVRSWYL